MTDTLYGLTPYANHSRTEMGFTNFQWVLPGKVARSSQPGYTGHDGVQKISMVQVMFLKTKGIRCIISANEYGIDTDSQNNLTKANIAYHHYSVKDMRAPSQFQLQNAADRMQQAISGGGGVLVYCGYGQGRTGTFVTAWAMLKYFAAADGKRKLSRNEMCNSKFLSDNFGVEKAHQVAAIRAVAALPDAEPATAGDSVRDSNSWTPAFIGSAGMGQPDATGTVLQFANFNGGGSGLSDVKF
ncbi:MAG: protein tyrosine phosphatase [Pseudomonadota bacterium]|nr:protein tyrosine phosphatase [Pseudomonadota bacterium]